MNDAEALAILRAGQGWISWDDELDRPHFDAYGITMDGHFAVAELLALVHFAPKEKP